MTPLKDTSLDVTGWTFGRFVDEIGLRFTDVPAIIASDMLSGQPRLRRWTYGELTADVHALQAALEDAGLKPGERVGVMLSSFAEWILYLFAVTRMGCAFVPINTRFRARELRHILEHSEANALVAMGDYLGHDHSDTIAEARGLKAGGAHGPLRQLRLMIGVGSRPSDEALDTDELLRRGRQLVRSHGVPNRTDDPQGIAILFYTSGTTSFPKGVPLTHANLLPHSVRAGGLLGIAPGERVLTLYPFFGISGGANKVLSTFGSGGTLVFQDSWRAEEASRMLDEFGCTVVHGVDVQVRELMAVRAARPKDGSVMPQRRATIAFMAGLDESVARGMKDALGIGRFLHPYGMTETNPMILRNELSDSFEDSLRPGGRVAPGVEVKVVDAEHGTDCAPGVPGQIVVRGATVMSDYFKDPAATASAFVDGWFQTGDQGVATSEGLIFYIGRLKDMLKVGGFNVAPQEIESFLRTVDGVADVAVAGAPDARLGEVPIAFVCSKPGAALDADALIELCRRNIANFKVPRSIYLVDALPYHTAANGSKLQRHVLRSWAVERAAKT